MRPSGLRDDQPAVLVVGGLDPSGGAGITQDVAAVRAGGGHPLAVLTAVAVQNSERVGERVDLTPDAVREQIELLAEEYSLGAIKVGMIPTAELAELLGSWLVARPRIPVVLDPVLRASSGAALGESGVANALLRHLVPRATVLTPNLEEAGVFLGRELEKRDDMSWAGRALRERGARWVLVKGGHLAKAPAVDFLSGPTEETWLEEERLPRGARGTGCALASLLAAGLARGDSVPQAARAAKTRLTHALRHAYGTGRSRYLDFTA